MEPYEDVHEMALVKPVPEGFTCWDKIVIDQGDITVAQLLKIFPEIHHGCVFQYVLPPGASN
jgi:hypothetical protein